MVYAENEGEIFLGRSITKTTNMSEETMRKVDSEIRRIIDEAYNRAKHLLSEHIDELHLLAKGLLEHETVSGDEIRQIIRGEPIVRARPDEPVSQGRGSVPSSGRPASRPPGGLNPGPAAAT